MDLMPVADQSENEQHKGNQEQPVVSEAYTAWRWC